MADVVCAPLDIKAVFGQFERHSHHSGIIEEDMETGFFREEGLCGMFDRLERGEVQMKKFNLGIGDKGFEFRDRLKLGEGGRLV